MSDLLYWVVRKRIAILLRFQEEYGKYISHSSSLRVAGSMPSDEAGVLARADLNLMLNEVSNYLREADCYPTVRYREAPVSGGRVMSIDVIQNLFRLNSFEIPDMVVTDYLQRAIGHYQNDLLPSLLRTINPFWWLWRGLRSVIGVPFVLLGWAGYDRDRAESSQVGRLFKFIVAIATITVGLIAFLDAFVQLLLNLGIDIEAIPFLQFIRP